MFAALGGLYLMVHPRFRWWGIMAWLGSYVVGYSLLGVPFYHWYAAPLALGGAILAGLGAQLLLDLIERFLRPNGRYVPPKVVLANTANEATFDALKDRFTSWGFYDNNVPFGQSPQFIAGFP